MKFKFVIRCVILLILANSIFSKNLIFSTKSNFNTSEGAHELETENKNRTDFVLNLSKLKRTILKSSKAIVRNYKTDKEVDKICSNEVDLVSNVVKVAFEERDHKFESKLSWSGDILFGSLLSIFSFLSFLGNSLSLVIFLFRHEKLSSVEVFFTNLSILDILLSVASYPMSTAAAFRHRWDFGQIGCTIYGFTCYLLGLACIASITSIALIRYFKTCDPAKGNQISCQTSGKIMAAGYLLALAWATMPLVGFGSYEVEPYGLSCTLNWMATNMASRIYIILVTIFVVLLPLLIIIFCYIKIIRVVRISNQKMKITGVHKRRTRSDMQLTWISVLITFGFIVAWSPYTIVCLYSSFCGKLLLPIWMTSLPTLLAKSSIILNPIIYIFFTERYRHDLAIQVKIWCSRIQKTKKGMLLE